MTDRELRHLNRGELLEMLIRLTKENEELKRNLEKTQRKLDDRKIMIDESGSIAEAALRLNDIFNAAENAAKLYIENSKRLCDENITKIRGDDDNYSAKIRAEADRYLEESRGKAEIQMDSVIAKAMESHE